MSNKHFHTLLSCSDVLHSIAVRRFAIKISLTNHFHFERSISLDDECSLEHGLSG
jgi:hypothetical protein